MATQNADYIAMLQRMIRALEVRAIDDPSILAEVIMLSQQLSEITNVVIATSAARYQSEGPMAAPSAGEIARLLGMSKQGAAARRKLGDRTLFERQMGEVRMATRERAARTKARNYAEETMGDWLSRREVSA